MKCLALAVWLLCAPGGDRERGLALYQEGRFAEAAAAFRAAIESEGDSAELQWNLAMALWRAGELASAEQAVERYAAQAAAPRADLHSGLLGAIRYGEAKAIEGAADEIARTGVHAAPPPAPVQGGPPPAAPPADPLPLLEQALAKAQQARDYLVRGGTSSATAPEVARNAERALRYVGELEKKIEELKKQREQQKQDEKDQHDQKQDGDKGDEKQDDDQKQQQGDQQKNDQQKNDQKQDQQKQEQKQEQKQDEQQKQDQNPDPAKEQPGEPKPEPKPEEQKPSEQSKEHEPKPEPQGKDEPEPKPGEQHEAKPEPKPEPAPDETKEQPAETKPRKDAPGEQLEGKELSPEQRVRLLEQLEKLDQQLKTYRARAQQGRRPVERDW
jgi:tetratricopeptide (TPR) repeat protein